MASRTKFMTVPIDASPIPLGDQNPRYGDPGKDWYATWLQYVVAAGRA